MAVKKDYRMIELWSKEESGSKVDTRTVDEAGRIRNVSIPRLVPFLPTSEKANGTAILVCPGGGYSLLAWSAHVERLAQRFNPEGIAVIGLEYRTSPPSKTVPDDALADLLRALCVVGANAAEWHIDPDRVVGLGFSAGANLLLNYACADDVALNEAKPSCVEVKLRHMALLCLWPHDKTADDYSIRTDAPSAFLCATEEDKTAPAAFSREIAQKLRRVGQDATVHVYPKGNHLAFNFKESGPDVDWTPDFQAWLSRITPK